MRRTLTGWPRLAGVCLIGLLALALLLVTSGCRRPSPPPSIPASGGQTPGPADPAPGTGGGGQTPGEPPAGTPQRPRIVLARVLLSETEDESGWVAGEISLADKRECVVGTDRLTFLVRLEPVPPASWYSENVRVTGADAQPLRQDLFGYGMVEVSYPKGQAGQKLSITLNSVVPPDGGAGSSVTYVFTRAAEPRAVISTWTGDRWRAVQPGEVLQAKPLRLRVQFTRPMDRAAVEGTLSEQLAGMSAVRWTAEGGGETLTFELTDPPPVVDLFLEDVRSADGLWLAGRQPAFYTGHAPRIELYDPGTRTADQRQRVMADIQSAQIDAGSGTLLLSALQRFAGFRYPDSGQWQVAPGDAAPKQLPPEWNYLAPPASGAMLRVRESEYQVVGPDGAVLFKGILPDSLSLLAISPDGGYLAGLVAMWELQDETTFLVPHDLVIVELTTDNVQWYDRFVSVYLPPTEWAIHARPAWSPDGVLVAAISDLPSGFCVMVADRRNGTVARGAEFARSDCGTMDHFTWSPDGRHWYVRDIQIPVQDPGQAKPLPVHGRSVVSHDGRWLAFGYDWHEVGMLELKTGELTPLGPGLIAGWDRQGRLYLIRWPDADYRYVYEGF